MAASYCLTYLVLKLGAEEGYLLRREAVNSTPSNKGSKALERGLTLSKGCVFKTPSGWCTGKGQTGRSRALKGLPVGSLPASLTV